MSKTDMTLAQARKTKMEMAGEQVMNHLMELGKTTDFSYTTMANKINDTYGLTINRHDVKNFFNKSFKLMTQMTMERKTLNKMRAGIFLEHFGVLTKDIKLLDNEIERLISEDEDSLMEPDKRARAVGDLIDKKGRLLIRHARLSGKLDGNSTNINRMEMEVNVFQQINEEKSDVIRRLKKADFGENIINIPNANNQTSP